MLDGRTWDTLKIVMLGSVIALGGCSRHRRRGGDGRFGSECTNTAGTVGQRIR